MAKVLVAYFSVSGVTEKIAKELAKAEDADLFQLCPAAPYTAAENTHDRGTHMLRELEVFLKKNKVQLIV